MKVLSGVLSLLLICISMGYAATHTITNSGFAFSPATLTVTAGDTIIFSLAGIHDAVEVSQATWDADGSTALSGGFSVPFGGGSTVLTHTGIHYYVCQPHASLGMKGSITVNPASATAVREGNGIPARFSLSQNYPNPFNPTTVITYEIPDKSFVSLRLFNLLGQEIATLVNEQAQPGKYSVTWDGSSQPSGIYFYTMKTAGFQETKKLMIVK